MHHTYIVAGNKSLKKKLIEVLVQDSLLGQIRNLLIRTPLHFDILLQCF